MALGRKRHDKEVRSSGRFVVEDVPVMISSKKLRLRGQRLPFVSDQGSTVDAETAVPQVARRTGVQRLVELTRSC